MGVDIKDVLGAGSAVEKLIDTISIAIGKLYEPIHLKRMAKAKAFSISAFSTVISDNSYVPIDYKESGISISNDIDEMAKRAAKRCNFQEMQRQQNMEQIIGQTYLELENERVVSSESLQREWVSRFFRSSGDISEENLQHLWSRVLAGEIKQPGSCSFRTMSVLENLNVQEAMLFSNILPYFVKWDEFYVTAQYLHLVADASCGKMGFSNSDILRLDECGLVNDTPNWKVNAYVQDPHRIICHTDRIALVANQTGKNTNIECECFRLTSAGEQLRRIIKPICSERYILMLNDCLEYNREKIKLSAHKIISMNGDHLLLDYDDNLLPYND